MIIGQLLWHKNVYMYYIVVYMYNKILGQNDFKPGWFVFSFVLELLP